MYKVAGTEGDLGVVHIDSLVEDWGISCALAKEMPRACITPSCRCKLPTFISGFYVLLKMLKYQYMILIIEFVCMFHPLNTSPQIFS